MNKEELVKLVSESTDVSKASVSKIFDAIFDSISKSLCGGDVVKIPGFGSFSISVTKEKNGRNPKTGELITIPAGKKLTFKVSQTLKEEIKK